MNEWNANQVVYLLPHAVAICLIAAVAIRAFIFREVSGAIPLVAVCVCQGLWLVGYVFEILSPTIAGKIFWDNFQFVWTAGWPMAVLWFVLKYTETNLPGGIFSWILLWMMPGAVALLAILDSWLQVIRPESHLIKGDPFDELVYPFIPFLSVCFLQILLQMTLCAIIIMVRLFWIARPYRVQAILISVAILLPVLGALLTLLEIKLLYQRDNSPFTFAISNILVLIGLTRFGFLRIVPVARDLIVAKMPDAVIVIDPSDRIVDINDAAVYGLGITDRRVHGQLLAEFLPQIVRLRDAGVEQPWRIISKSVDDGDRIFDCRQFSVMKRRHAFAHVLVLRDITRQDRAESELAIRATELEQLNRELETFSYTVSHDLRTPVRAIKGFASILMDDHVKDDEARHLLNRIVNAGDRMVSMIDALLDLSLVSRSQMQRKPVDLTELARACFRESSSQIDAKIQNGMMAHGDEALIRVVFNNLLGNAIKFSAQTQNPLIQISQMDSENGKTFFVRDNGAGFDQGSAEKLFRPFERLHSSEFAGTGIGLATVARIIDRHGGKIWAEGRPGVGATFYFTLPE